MTANDFHTGPSQPAFNCNSWGGGGGGGGGGGSRRHHHPQFSEHKCEVYLCHAVYRVKTEETLPL